MAGKPKIKYVQLEPAEYPADPDWMAMTPAERGIYHSLIIYLSCNDGKLDSNSKKLSILCNTKRDVFDNFWTKFGKKFQQRNEIIKHKRVSKVLRRARKLIKQRSLAGKASAYARSTSVQRENNFSFNEHEDEKEREREREEKELLRNTCTEEKSLSATSSLRFVDALERIIKPKDQSDRTSFRNLTGWIAENIIQKKFNDEIYARILQYAKDAQTGRRPVAVFFATLKRELGYRNLKGGK